MVKILVKEYDTDRIVKEFDVSDKSVHSQEKTYDAVVMKTDLERFYVVMDCPENK